MRHSLATTARPDGTVWVRTYPLTALHDFTLPTEAHVWDQLAYATAGALAVDTATDRWLVPPRCALWIPAGTEHREIWRAPISVRSLFVAPGLARALPRRCAMVNVSPFLHALVLRVCGHGALDRRVRAQAHLADVLLDELVGVVRVPLQLPMPRDARARRLAEAVLARPNEPSSVETQARRAGASRRTAERLFTAETGMTVGTWRRRARLLHAVTRLAGGATVAAAAAAAGYDSPSAFIAAFRRVFGTTPRRYAPPAGDPAGRAAEGRTSPPA